jgi:hypothetical protein
MVEDCVLNTSYGNNRDGGFCLSHEFTLEPKFQRNVRHCLVLCAFGVLTVTGCQQSYVVEPSPKVELRALQAKALRAYQQCMTEHQKTPTETEKSCANEADRLRALGVPVTAEPQNPTEGH